MRKFFLWLACRIPTVSDQVESIQANLDYEQYARLRQQIRADEYKKLVEKYGPSEGSRIEIRNDHEVMAGKFTRVALFGCNETPYLVPDCLSLHVDTESGSIKAYCDNQKKVNELQTEEALLNMEIERLQQFVQESDAALVIANKELADLRIANALEMEAPIPVKTKGRKRKA